MDQKDLLSSWKEVSVYLGFSIKTCQRWEAVFGLPIHRLDGGARSRVFARKTELDHWLAERGQMARNSEAGAGGARGRTKRRFLFAGSSCAVLIVLGAMWGWHRYILATPIPEIRPSLAILNFRNASGASALEDWTAALPDLITTDLIQSRFIWVLPRDRVEGLLDKLGLVDARSYLTEDLARLAGAGAIDYAVSGEVMPADEKATVVTCALQKASTGEIVRTFRRICLRPEDVFGTVDSLTRGIKKALRISARQMAADIDQKVMRITTPVPEALLLYKQGYQKALYGRDPEAAVCFEKAVALDTTFALGYQSLWSVLSRLGREKEALEYLRKAYEFSGRASKVERLLIAGNYHEFIEKDVDKAIANYWRMHLVRPQDGTGYGHLSRIYGDREDWPKVIEINEGQLAVTPHVPPGIYVGLSQAYCAQGFYEKAEGLLDGILANLGTTSIPFNNARTLLHIMRREFSPALGLALTTQGVYPDNPFTGLVVGQVHQYRGDFAAAERIYREALSLGGDQTKLSALFALANLYLDQGRLAASTETLERAAEAARSSGGGDDLARARKGLALRHLLAGDLERAQKESQEACRIAESSGTPDAGAVFSSALCALELGQMKEFDIQTEALRRILRMTGNPKALRQYDLLLGLRARKLGRIREAVELFEKAVSLLPLQTGDEGRDQQAAYYDALAQARLDGGDLAAASDMYARITQLTTGRAGRGDIYARSFYRLGTICEAQGRIAEAAEYYMRFVGLWRDADAELTEVAAARKRLSFLGHTE